ncbi:hypothetical protein Bbelb_129770 [Branchiostoma belcheri]|nr:hypothetical protein Bbelb_129770 [Branchiostoma belcheri]
MEARRDCAEIAMSATSATVFNWLTLLTFEFWSRIEQDCHGVRRSLRVDILETPYFSTKDIASGRSTAVFRPRLRALRRVEVARGRRVKPLRDLEILEKKTGGGHLPISAPRHHQPRLRALRRLGVARGRRVKLLRARKVRNKIGDPHFSNKDMTSGRTVAAGPHSTRKALSVRSYHLKLAGAQRERREIAKVTMEARRDCAEITMSATSATVFNWFKLLLFEFWSRIEQDCHGVRRCLRGAQHDRIKLFMFFMGLCLYRTALQPPSAHPNNSPQIQLCI